MYKSLPGFLASVLQVDAAAGTAVHTTDWVNEAAALDATSQMAYRKAMHSLVDCFDGEPEVTTAEIRVPPDDDASDGPLRA
jgi:hypothetical protein